MDQKLDFTDQISIILFAVAMFMFDTLSLSSENCAVASFYIAFKGIIFEYIVYYRMNFVGVFFVFSKN